MTKKPFMTPKEYVKAVVLAVFMIIMTFSIVYFQETITIPCLNDSKEVYFKSDLHLVKEICGGLNYYKYNDNSGLGAYFPSEEAVNKVIDENQELSVVFE